MKTLTSLSTAMKDAKFPAKIVPFRAGPANGGFREFALPGDEETNEAKPDETQPAIRPPAPVFWALPNDSTLWVYYAGKKHMTVQPFDQTIVLNKAWFREHFSFKRYNAAVKDLQKKAAAEGHPLIPGPDLPTECERDSAHCMLDTIMKNIILRTRVERDEPHVFKVLWEENLQTPVTVVGILPLGLFDLIDFGREVAKQPNRSIEPPPLDGRGLAESGIKSVRLPVSVGWP